MTRTRVVCTLLLVLVAPGCDRLRRKKPRAEPTPPIAASHLRVDVNGNVLAPKLAVAATRGGETVYLTIGTRDRTCEDLYDKNGIGLAEDEVLVQLEIARPLFDEDDRRRPIPGAGAWRVTRASWPGGQSGARRGFGPDAPLAGAIEADPAIATKGGRMRLRYDGEFHVGAASPRATLALDGVIDVRACGDRPRAALGPPMPIEVRAGARRLPIRGALVVQSNDGPRLYASSLARPCPKHDAFDVGGDLEIDLRLGAQAGSAVHVAGDLLATQLVTQPSPYVVTPHGPLTGAGPVEVSIDGDGSSYLPLSIHGRVSAERCPLGS